MSFSGRQPSPQHLLRVLSLTKSRCLRHLHETHGVLLPLRLGLAIGNSPTAPERWRRPSTFPGLGLLEDEADNISSLSSEGRWYRHTSLVPKPGRCTKPRYQPALSSESQWQRQAASKRSLYNAPCCLRRFSEGHLYYHPRV